ncbi:MAG: hypothetical protein HYY93_07155 [Planctomycetes bacterium]|nr:hypothetical protein [Planctomycetota bacterium]
MSHRTFRVWLISALLCLCSTIEAEDQPPPLEPVLKALSSDSAAARSAASTALDDWCRAAGAHAADLLRARLETAGPGLKPRIEEQIAFLDQLADTRKFLSFFELLDLPAIHGKPYVLLNTGTCTLHGQGTERALWFHYAAGWLIEESATEVKTLNEVLGVNSFKRVYDLPKEWDEFASKHPPDMPLPGQVIETPIGDLVARWLTDESTFMLGEREQAVTRESIRAWFALCQDQERGAVALTERARQKFQQGVEWAAPNDRRSAEEVAVTGLAIMLRTTAIGDGHAGAPRPQCLDLWRRIARLPPTYLTPQVAETAAAYEAMIEEDAKWKEPTSEELSAMNVSDRVEYWLYKLRDLSISQSSQPGHCYVCGPWGWPQDRAANPAKELVRLGWEAVPQIIAHLDDPRPTRCLGFWRNFMPSSNYLLRYADCCQQIFEEITGYPVFEERSTHSYPWMDGKCPEMKRKAGEWWDSARTLTAEDRLWALLDTNPAGATVMLLKMDSEGTLPRLLDEAGKRRSVAILDELGSRLSQKHVGTLESFLSAESPRFVLSAARIQWSPWGVESGAREVARRLHALADIQDPEASDWAVESVDFLAVIPRDFAVESLCSLTAHPNKEVRIRAIEKAADVRDPRVAEALMTQTMCPEKVGYSRLFETRFCDLAAESLQSLLAFEPEMELSRTVEDNDAYIARLTEWWTANRDGLRRELEIDSRKR